MPYQASCTSRIFKLNSYMHLTTIKTEDCAVLLADTLLSLVVMYRYFERNSPTCRYKRPEDGGNIFSETKII
jgi:hypothetical protein